MARHEIAALALAVSLVPLNSTMLAVAIPTIARDLSVSGEVLTQGLVAAYLLVGIVLQSPGGKLGDGIGHARTLGLGQIVFAAGAIAGFLARDVLLLEASRALMAAGGAVIVPSAFALVRSRAPHEAQTRAFGAFGAVMGLSAAVGPLIGGELVARFGWPSLFAVNAPLVLLSALLGRGGVREPRRAMPGFDVLGSLLLGAGLVLAVLGLRTRRLAMVGAGVLVLLAFFAWERRAKHPVIEPSLFQRRAFAAGVSVVGLHNLGMYGLLFELPLLLARAFGGDARTSGQTLLALTLAMVLGSLSGGRMVARFGTRTAALVGCSLALAGSALLGGFTPSSARDLVPGLVLLGAGIGLATPAVQTASMAAVDRAKSGMAAGVSSTSRYLGGVIGVGVVSTLLAGAEPIGAHLQASRWITGVMVAALLAAAALPRAIAAKT